MICRIIALAVLITAAFMLVPLLLAVADSQPRNIWAYAVTIVTMILFGSGLILYSRKAHQEPGLSGFRFSVM